MRFKDQVAVVTGASRGIGRAIAEGFGREGARVACIATSLANAEGTAKGLQNAKAYALDVSDSTAVSEAFEQIEKELGVPNILVNNAGITRDQLMMRMKDEDFDQVIAVNLRGAYLCSKAVCRGMLKARSGRIINVSSVVGLHGAAGQVNYAASKAGVIGMTKALAREFGSRGITVNAVAPGYIETDMTVDLPQEMRDRTIAQAPLGRLGAPSDVAYAILFLASTEASYITGQVLTIDGGLTI